MYTARYNKGISGLSSVVKQRLTSFKFPNCNAEEQNDTELFCAAWEWDDVIPRAVTGQSTGFYVKTASKNDCMAKVCLVGSQNKLF